MSDKNKPLTRILALDLHPRSFGYAVFENATLLDWGVRKWPSRQLKTTGRKLRWLMDLWRPMHLVIREGAPRPVHAKVEELAKGAKIRLFDVRRTAVQDAFRHPKRPSRFEVARVVARRYPELGPRLAATRMLGHAEPFQLRMFSAVATCMAFLRIPAYTLGSKK